MPYVDKVGSKLAGADRSVWDRAFHTRDVNEFERESCQRQLEHRQTSDNLVDLSVLVRLINTEESIEGLLMLQCYLKTAFEPRELCHHVIFYTS